MVYFRLFSYLQLSKTSLCLRCGTGNYKALSLLVLVVLDLSKPANICQQL